MTFWDYLNTTQPRELKGITEELTKRLSTLIGRGHSVADLLAHYGDDFGHLPASRLQDLARSHRSWQIWHRRKTQLNKARTQAKLPPLPAEIGRYAATPHALDAVLRTTRFCPRKSVTSDEAWLTVLRAGAELWEACVGIARKETIVRCEAIDLQSAAAQHYDDYVRERETLGDIAPHRWLAMRRGVKEKALAVHFEFPQEAMERQVEIQRENLGDGAEGRGNASILDELVLDALPAWLTTILDQEAEASAIAAAAESLSGLLKSPPLQARRLVAIFVGRPKAPIGAVVTDREGELLAHRVLKSDGGHVGKIVELIREYNIHHVAVPTNAPADKVLATLHTELAKHDLQVVPIRPAAISEARRPFMDPPMRLGQSAASALVLARRALDPIKEWALVDPVSIGIAEYQHDLNQDRLRAALKEIVELNRLERRRSTKGSGHNQAGSAPRGVATMARLNPLVKTIADLRGGMTVHGIVTNISHFGAFINIGLPQEALVHISELSDRFVSNPNEVVSIGQQVAAHVLAVDPPRGRISLSMKTQRRAPPGGMGRRDDRPASGGGGDMRPRPGGGGGGRQPPQSRAEALASLERLFKK